MTVCTICWAQLQQRGQAGAKGFEGVWCIWYCTSTSCQHHEQVPSLLGVVVYRALLSG